MSRFMTLKFSSNPRKILTSPGSLTKKEAQDLVGVLVVKTVYAPLGHIPWFLIWTNLLTASFE